MLLVFLLLISAPPRVGQIPPDVRMGTGAWLAGEGFTGATVKYDNTITVTKDNLESEVRAALAGPTIDWMKQGQDAPTYVYNDQVAITYPNVEQIGAYCVPFAVRGRDGISKTYCINCPRIYGLAGVDPKALSASATYPIVGRHLAATRAKPSVWIMDKEGRSLSRCEIVSPGGTGTGNVVDISRSVLWFNIPATTPPGNYSLFIFTGENRWGLSNLLPITIIGPKPPPTVISVQLSPGSAIDGLITSAKPGSVLQLPPGQFLVTKPSDLGSTVTIVGSGKNTTTLKGSPSLSADKTKLVGARDAMLRLTGDNITFRDLTIELTPNTTRSAIAAGTGIDSVQFDSVRFLSTTAAVNSSGYCDGYFYRFGLHRYWRFSNCDFECQFPFEGTNGQLNGFRANGAFDYGLVTSSRFRPPHGLLSGSLLGSCLGRGSLLFSNEITNSRRGLALSSGDGTLESVVACNSFHDMLSELGNGEAILHESRGSLVAYVKSADANSITPFGNDPVDKTRWTVAIISGRGFGQYRVVSSSSKGAHTIESPWEIVPDQTSCVLFSQCPTDCSFVFNRFTNTVGGINLYGNSFGCLINSNWFRDSREGAMLNTNWNVAACLDPLGQNGDGRSLAWWHTFRSNIFEDGTGFNFRAPRASLDLLIWKNPQIAFINTAFNQSTGTVTNQLWASEGLDTENASITATTTLKTPLIDYISSTLDVGYSGKSKYHAPVIDQRPPQPLWYRTASGIGSVRIGAPKYDDLPMPPEKSIQVAP